MALLLKLSTRVKIFIVIFLLCVLVIFITAFSSYLMRLKQTNDNISEIIQDKLHISEISLHQHVADISNMLNMVNGYIYDNRISDLKMLTDSEIKAHFTDFIYTIANSYNGIMQIRVIDNTGMEVVRAEREAIGSPVVFTGDNYLQNKKHRYYFSEAMKVENGKIWISDIDLNYEYGNIDFPLRPTIRFATPVFYNGEKSGLIIINHFAETLLTYFNSYKNINIYLASKDGHYIVHPDSTFDFSKDKNLNKLIFDDYPFLKNLDDRQQISDGSKIIARKLHLAGNNYLYAVFDGNTKYLSKIHLEQFLLSMVIYSMSIIFAFVLTAYISKLYANEYDNKVNEVTKVKASASKLLHQVGELEDRVYIDPLTGAFNRRYHDERLKHIIDTGVRFGFIIIDIDHFKMVNDNFGHSVGDQVLQEMSELIQANIRNSDFLVRWGGEEFCLILPNMVPEILPNLAEKLRRIIETYTFCTENTITASFGATMNIPGESEKDLLERADEALYNSKEMGRNMVTVK